MTRTVDAGPVRRHLDVLVASGMSTGQIAAAAGLANHRSVWRLMNDPNARMSRQTAGRILAVHPAQLPEELHAEAEVFVPAEFSRRRVRALLALGWTHARMLELSGVRTAVMLNAKEPRVTWRTHVRVRTMYEQLSMTLGPSQATRTRARKAGYPPPLAWDDDAIDRPDGQPWKDLDDLDEPRTRPAG